MTVSSFAFGTTGLICPSVKDLYARAWPSTTFGKCRNVNKPPKRRILSHEALVDTLDALREEEGGAELVVAGGLAMQSYGSDRLTADLDLLASTVPALVFNYAKKPTKLSFGGVRFEADGVPVDIIVRNDELCPLYEEAHRQGVRNMKIGRGIVPMEYLAVIKMAAGRAKDMLDLTFLLTHPRLKYPKTREIAVKYLGWYAGKELDSLLAEAKWKKESGIE